MLARAMLEQGLGDALYPGIEVYWIAKVDKTYITDDTVSGLNPPFRVDHDVVLPGFLTLGLSLPWQTDFSACNTHWYVRHSNHVNHEILILPQVASLAS